MNRESETFRSTGSRVFGVLGLVVVAYVVGDGLLRPDSGVSVEVMAVALFSAAVLWVAMLRPVVVLTRETLTLRNMVTTVDIPLAAVEEVVVRQVLAVRAGQRHTSAAVGRSRRQLLRDGRTGAPAGDVAEGAEATSYGSFVETRIRSWAESARARGGITLYSDEQEALGARVRRQPAWLEIGLLLVTGLGAVLLIAL